MKKLLVVLLAFLLFLAAVALADENGNPALGDWYADLNGIPVSLSLNPDGTYVYSALGEVSVGVWEPSDGFVVLDGDGQSPLNVVSDTFMVYRELGLFFTREPIRVYTPAGDIPAGGPDWFNGYWKSLYAEAAGEPVLAETVGDDTDLYIEGSSVALGGKRFGDIWWNFTFSEGRLSAELEGGEQVTVSIQKDGLLRLDIVNDGALTTLWLHAALTYQEIIGRA